MDEAARDVRAAASQRIQQTEEAAAEKLARIKAGLSEAKERIAELETSNQQERERASNDVHSFPLSHISEECFKLPVLYSLGKASVKEITEMLWRMETA